MVEIAAQPGVAPRATRRTALLSMLTDAIGAFMPSLADLCMPAGVFTHGSRSICAWGRGI